MALRIIKTGTSSRASAFGSSGQDDGLYSPNMYDNLARSVELVSSGLHFSSILSTADKLTEAVEKAELKPVTNSSLRTVAANAERTIGDLNGVLHEVLLLEEHFRNMLELCAYEDAKQRPEFADLTGKIESIIRNMPEQKVVKLFDPHRPEQILSSVWRKDLFNPAGTVAEIQMQAIENGKFLASVKEQLERMLAGHAVLLTQAIVARENTVASQQDVSLSTLKQLRQRSQSRGGYVIDQYGQYSARSTSLG